MSRRWITCFLALGMFLVLLTALVGRNRSAEGTEIEPAHVAATGMSENVIIMAHQDIFEEFERPPVLFDHQKHTESLKDQGCKVCHTADEKGNVTYEFLRIEGNLDRRALIDAYHEKCMKCHNGDGDSEAGEEAKALGCGECHIKKDTYATEQWYPATFEHFRHIEAMEAGCDTCHHAYDEEQNKLVYQKGEEASCGECHGEKDERTKAVLLGKELEEKEKREKALLSKLDEAPKIAPVIVIVTPKDGSTSEGEMIKFSGVVEDEKGLERVDIFLNNAQLVTRGLRVTEKKYRKRLEFQEGILLQVGENEIMLRAVDSDGLSSEKAVKVHYLKRKIDVKSTALLIGVSEYEHWDSLMNPTTDIEAIATELEQYYGFDIRKLRNVSKTEILTKIRELAKGSYREDEQLLIWFSGHGYFDDLSKIGYIVAKDTLSLSADPIFDTFLDYPKLMRIISNIPCRHILLVVDACFAGTLDSRLAMRSTDLYADIPKEEYIQRKLKFKTRLYLTSGGKQYVSDGRPGQHSPFTGNFWLRSEVMVAETES